MCNAKIFIFALSLSRDVDVDYVLWVVADVSEECFVFSFMVESLNYLIPIVGGLAGSKLVFGRLVITQRQLREINVKYSSRSFFIFKNEFSSVFLYRVFIV